MVNTTIPCIPSSHSDSGLGVVSPVSVAFRTSPDLSVDVPELELDKTLPEAQRTQGIDSLQLNRMPFALVTNLANVVPLELVQNLTTRWCHQHGFQI